MTQSIDLSGYVGKYLLVNYAPENIVTILASSGF
jgi:hypothetical protein